MKQGTFAGFPAQTVAFFRGLERNNRREWFQARKEVFDESVKAPMVELVTAINGELARWAPEYVTDASTAIYRFYRDTRFSADKTPYKDHIAATFRRRGLVKHGSAGFYFSVSHKEFEVAGGVYMPGPEQLLAIRTHIGAHHQEFRRLMQSAGLRKLMGEMQGEQLSRVPKGFAADHPAADLLRYKQWLWYVVLDPALVTTPAVYSEVVKRFKVMLPALEFLNAPLARRKQDPVAAMFV